MYKRLFMAPKRVFHNGLVKRPDKLPNGKNRPEADMFGPVAGQGADRIITDLVDDILFLSELEQGREVVALGETEAAPVLRAVVDELSERAEMAGLTLVVRIEDETIEVPLSASPTAQEMRERVLRKYTSGLR